MGIRGQVLAFILWSGSSYGAFVALAKSGIGHNALATIIDVAVFATSSFALMVIIRHFKVGLMERQRDNLTRQKAALMDAIIAAGKPITMTDEVYASFKERAEGAGADAMERFRKVTKLAGRG